MSITVSVLSVSADMKNFMAVFYQNRRIRKLSLSGFMGMGHILIQGVRTFLLQNGKKDRITKMSVKL